MKTVLRRPLDEVLDKVSDFLEWTQHTAIPSLTRIAVFDVVLCSWLNLLPAPYIAFFATVASRMPTTELTEARRRGEPEAPKSVEFPLPLELRLCRERLDGSAQLERQREFNVGPVGEGGGRSRAVSGLPNSNTKTIIEFGLETAASRRLSPSVCHRFQGGIQ